MNEEKKLTDEEIVKVMKCCAERCLLCDECPLREDSWCSNKVLPMGIDLIYRQKAEIERLKKRHGVALLRNDDLDLENYELKKQVDALKLDLENWKMSAYGYKHGEEQAVKDTADKIVCGLLELFPKGNTSTVITLESIHRIVKEATNGVEVE